ncbi:hypothetical protein B0T17DRAFT_617485 [Bombardia bombarda]|uniref:Rhodopsin domain-containing protein n=1 Tax=Bombardia bombarda TaxID=252184 RepID=A0AA39X165_9PEZI|nr:hypothetical protein B0T17DRAFT_617485 [Bombardia bombarda]
MTPVNSLTYPAQRNYATVITCLVISFVAVLLRFWCKIISKVGVQSDDWWMVLAFMSFLAGNIAVLWGILNGTGGREIPELLVEMLKFPDTRLEALRGAENLLESIWVGYLFGVACLYTTKVSVCLMYRRIFSTYQFHLQILVFLVFATAWYIATTLPMFFICESIDGFWHELRNPPPQCTPGFKFNLFTSATSIVEVIMDAVLLVLPIRAMIPLRLHPRAKIIVSGIFLIGGFAILTNILRIYYQYQPDVPVPNFNTLIFWLEVHIATTILCACLPAYGPLRSRCPLAITAGNSLDRFWGGKSLFSPLKRPSSPSSYSLNRPLSNLGIVGIPPRFEPGLGAATQADHRVKRQPQYGAYYHAHCYATTQPSSANGSGRTTKAPDGDMMGEDLHLSRSHQETHQETVLDGARHTVGDATLQAETKTSAAARDGMHSGRPYPPPMGISMTTTTMIELSLPQHRVGLCDSLDVW